MLVLPHMSSPISSGCRKSPAVPRMHTRTNTQRKIRSITIATYFQSSWTCRDVAWRGGAWRGVAWRGVAGGGQDMNSGSVLIGTFLRPLNDQTLLLSMFLLPLFCRLINSSEFLSSRSSFNNISAVKSGLI